MDSQSAFWTLRPYLYGKTFPAFPFSPATAATERKNGNGMLETRHKCWGSYDVTSVWHVLWQLCIASKSWHSFGTWHLFETRASEARQLLGTRCL